MSADYVVGTRRTDAGAVADWLGCAREHLRPLPADRAGLVITRQGPRLCVPGAAPLYWSPGLTPRRLARGLADVLPRTLALRPGERVLDGTLGMGFDALVLAHAGARVIGWERRAIVLYFTAHGLWRYRPDLARRVHYACVDTREGLAARPVGWVDHVYLDPMFPPGGQGPNLAPLRALHGDDQRPTAALIEAARRVARRRVVLKLAPAEAAPLPGAEIVATKRVRYAVWGA